MTTHLVKIAPQSWEHPTDRAALQLLRTLPGLDELLKWLFGVVGEKGVRLLFQANAVRVGPKQFPQIYETWRDVCATLDADEMPELFITQTPHVNAGAYGMDRPFVVLNSGTMHLFGPREMAHVLGHELGHVLSGHALYHTMLVMILRIGLSQLPGLAGIAVTPIRLALLEWYRKSELSCDCAGLLACQDPNAAMSTFLKLAGGGKDEETDLTEFLKQANEYEARSELVETVLKFLNTMDATHPFATLRAAELQRWIQGGAYDRILRGEYVRRGQPSADGARDAASESVAYYAGKGRESLRPVLATARKVGDVVNSAADAIRKSWEAS